MGKGTRSALDGGYVGNITDTELKDGDAKGFGVFAAYTEDKQWNGTGGDAPDKTPDFMYNQQVYFSSDWIYSPIKYWPNDNSTADDQSATATGKAYVSYFAYAPYTSAGASDGITGFSPNNANADPWVSYKLKGAGTINGEVDLLWGTAQSSVNINGTTQGTGAATGILTGEKVNIDMTKQKTVETTADSKDNRVKFLFKHALAMFGGDDNSFTIIADIDNGGNTSGGAYETVGGNKNTKVTLKSIRIKQNDSDKLYNAGKLNLATGQWTDLSGALDFDISRAYTDTPTQYLNSDIMEPDAATVTGWATTWTATEYIKTDEARNVFANGKAPQFLFIPGTTPKFDITVCYVVRTQDAKLASKFTEVEQTVSKTITFASAAELNKKYKIAIHLGLTTVKFTASVQEWAAGNSGASSNLQVDLPINVD